MRHSRRTFLQAALTLGGAAALGCSSKGADNSSGDDGGVADGSTGDGGDAPLVFDYYISTTGSDANPGTLDSPWAITALNTKKLLYTGKTVGLLDGVYDVSALMPSDGSYYAAALEVDGGSADAPTIIAAVHPRQATLDAKGASGYYGGHPATQSSILRHGAAEAHQGNLVIDGLRFTGFKTGAIQIGTYASSSAVAGIVIRNCELFDGSGLGAPTDNFYALEINECVGATVRNNYFHDLVGWTATTNDHLSSILVWHSHGTTIEYNTCIDASNIFGKEDGNEGTTLRFNFVRAAKSTSPISDWSGAPGTGLTQTTEIHHNVLVADSAGMSLLATLGGGAGWSTMLRAYNNTIVLDANGIVNQSHFAAFMKSGSIEWYNNLLVGSLSPDRKMICANARAWAKCGYNVYPASGTRWRRMDDTTGDPDAAAGDYADVATYRAAVETAGGLPATQMEAGLVETAQGPAEHFAQTGTNAELYKLADGSSAKSAGRSDGTSGGTPCDAGAWGGASPPSRIGCDFA